MASKTFRTRIVREGSSCFIPLTFDPKTVFGKVRAPVRVTLNGHTYRSTIAAMGGSPCVPLRKSNREAAGLEGGETIDVRLDLDTDKREVTPPVDFVEALKATPRVWERWRALSYTHRREHVEAIEGAKNPETRTRRIENAIRVIRRTSKGRVNRAMHLTVAFGAAGDRRPFQDSPSGLKLSAETVLALGIHIVKRGQG